MICTREDAFRSLGKEVMDANYVGDDVIRCVQRFADSEEFQAVKNIFKKMKITPSSSKLLDLGAGNGIASWSFAHLGFTVDAVEPDPSPLLGRGAIGKLAKAEKTRVGIHKAIGEGLPFADNTFHVVYSRSVLHHAQDLNQMLKEIWRVLKPNGIFLACREHIISKPDDQNIFLNRHIMYKLAGIMQQAHLVEEYRSSFGSAGLDVLRIFSTSKSPINYPSRETRNKIKKFVRARYGRVISEMLLKIPMFYEYFTEKHDRFDNMPGRLYTFLCRKTKKLKRD